MLKSTSLFNRKYISYSVMSCTFFIVVWRDLNWKWRNISILACIIQVASRIHFYNNVLIFKIFFYLKIRLVIYSSFVLPSCRSRSMVALFIIFHRNSMLFNFLYWLEWINKITSSVCTFYFIHLWHFSTYVNHFARKSGISPLRLQIGIKFVLFYGSGLTD